MKTAMKSLIALALTMSVMPAALAERESGGRLGALAVLIQYSSPGNGINSELKNEIDQAIEGHFPGEVTKIVIRPWGREGERDVCVEFSDVTLAYKFDVRVQDMIKASPGEVSFKRTSAKRVFNCSGTVVTDPRI